ncbi:MAG: amidohydrolase family protein [Mycobacteriaceae bacterium]
MRTSDGRDHRGTPGTTAQTVIRAARIHTGSGTVLQHGFVLVDGGVIVAVEGAGTPPPEDVETVDLGEVTLLPGLIDAHVHLAFDATGDVMTPMLELEDDALLDLMHTHAQLHLDAGVTTVRDLGDRRFGSLVLRDRYRSDPASGPELLASGPPLTRRKGHCWFLGGEADTIDELHAAVSERAERECDVVKVMATGGVITPGFLPHQSQYGPAELTAIVTTAHHHRLPTVAHAHGAQGIRDSVAAGVRSIEHCTFLDATGVSPDWDAVARMIDAGIFASVTGASLPGLELPPVLQARAEQVRVNVQRMHTAGARIVCTSDAGVGPHKPHGVLPHGVVDAARVGFSNVEALASVTTVAAAACGLAGRKGAITAGHDADLLAVQGNPLETIGDIHRTAAVFRRGLRVR